MTTTYKLKRNMPVAEFFYKGQSHTHPVRRKVVLIETDDKEVLTGFEIRSGRKSSSSRDETPIKSYRREDIARWGDYQKLRRYPDQIAKIGESTLRRAPLRSLTNDEMKLLPI